MRPQEAITQDNVREPDPFQSYYAERTKLLCDLRAQLNGANGIMRKDFTLARVWHQHSATVETASITAALPLIDKAITICDDLAFMPVMQSRPYDPELRTLIDEIWRKLVHCRNERLHHPRQRTGAVRAEIEQALHLSSVALQRDCDLSLRALNETRTNN